MGLLDRPSGDIGTWPRVYLIFMHRFLNKFVILLNDLVKLSFHTGIPNIKLVFKPSRV